ncbi:hypothetical protein [Alteromonas stellipolaris]|uniref:hypothetical protein n=1 Tax=Alteromonas stellipolaris TaxID=233316 RepID=UPI002733A716|nr:hypothetical protein [Alteromonas stellipolaris]MDP2537565.1 hypothetical protein [Alteromonas stellipolaris]
MNVVNLHAHRVTSLADSHIDEAAEPCAKLIGGQSKEETEQLWKKRLNLYVNAEKKLLKITRLRKVTGVVTLACMGALFFSLYMAPILTPFVFFSMVVVMALGVATYPAWFLLGRSSQKTRDSISRMFYQSNHELEIADGKVTLINRASYANVTHVNILDSNLGQFVN